MSEDATDPATAAFLAHRNLLFTVAYEMLGSAADSEDVLQETWLRWSRESFQHALQTGDPQGCSMYSPRTSS
ncbi:sigma factor [Nocardia sp. NPDC052316]|uniref:sigma factor n=1 Tax=Nocardia sp. NPDC052316 TaxID=3364329 RepID=UPI0037C9CD96